MIRTTRPPALIRAAAATAALAGAVLVVLLPASCGPASIPWPPGAAEVRLGEESCAHCRMIVSDGRFAAQARFRDGTLLVFDDVGCLASARGTRPFETAGVFVRSFADDGWVRATDGWTVRSAAIASPMGNGIAAFPSRTAAEDSAKSYANAVVAPLTDLLGGPPAGPHERAPR